MSELTPEQYEALLAPLSYELGEAARWVSETGQRIVILLEGRDTAGKGGTIYAISRHLNPRECKSVALPAPSSRERKQWYFQRYVPHLPAKGEIVLFDRSWYNRAGVERVMDFATEAEVNEFLEAVPQFERQLVEDGVLLFKYWLTCSHEKQEKRFEARLASPLKRWKISPIDIQARAKYDAYTEARERMFAATHTPEAPWVLVDFEDQPLGRLTLIRDLLDRLPDTRLPEREILWPQLPYSPKGERFTVLQPIPNYLEVKDRPRLRPPPRATAATAAMSADAFGEDADIPRSKAAPAAFSEPAAEPPPPAQAAPPPAGNLHPSAPPPASASPATPSNVVVKGSAMSKPIPLLVQVSSYYLLLIALVAALVWVLPQAWDYLPLGGAKGLVLEAATAGSDLTGTTSFRPTETVGNFGETLVWLATAIIGALLAALPVAWIYMGIRTEEDYDQSLIATIIMLPVVVTSIVVIVQNSLALAFALAGIAGAVRFKNDLKSPGDALFILLAVGIGLSAGTGAVELSLIMSIAFNYCFLALWWTELGERAGMKRYMTDRDPNDPESLSDPWRGVGR
jgi:polyphosphate kinase 2